MVHWWVLVHCGQEKAMKECSYSCVVKSVDLKNGLMYLVDGRVGSVKESGSDLSHNDCLCNECKTKIKGFKIVHVYNIILTCLTTPNFCVQLVQTAYDAELLSMKEGSLFCFVLFIVMRSTLNGMLQIMSLESS